MTEIFVVSGLYGLLGVLVAAREGDARARRGLFWSLGLLAALAILAAWNFEKEIFEQKFASEFAFNLWSGEESPRDHSTFILQALINAPAFWLTERWWAAIGVNVALVIWLFAVLWRLRPEISWMAFTPAIVNFSLFSLRDPIVMGVIFLAVLSFCDPRVGRRLAGQGVAALALLAVRPELAVLLVLANAIRSAWDVRHLAIAPVLLLLFGCVFVAGLMRAPHALGLQAVPVVWDLPLLFSDFFEARAGRWSIDEGGGSNILAGRLAEFGFFPRYAVQLVSFFILPLPFEITRLPLAFAFLDSVVFCYVAWRFHQEAPKAAKIFFWIYVAAVSLFSSNYGNVFRMRLPAYGILLAGLLRGARARE
ncbi:MAG: hypothetical protein AAGD04_13840 [Pseudomonadota bacterium]